MEIRRFVPAIYIASSIMLLSSTHAAALSENGSRAKNLFMIILNCVRYSDTFGDKNHLYIENIWKTIKPHGTLCKNVYNNSATFPLPAQSTLLTGVSSGNSDTFPNLSSPALFEYYRRQSGAIKNKVLFFAGDPSFTVLSCSNHADYGKEYAPDMIVNDTADIGEAAICGKIFSYLRQHHPSLAVISLTTGSLANHHSSENKCGLHPHGLEDACGTVEFLNMYYEGIIMNDMIIRKTWEQLQADEFYKDNTVFIVASSHGRHTGDYSSYGDDCEGCRRLMFLVAGPGIRKNYVSGKKRYLTDVLPTIGKILGIRTEKAPGNVMSEILAGNKTQ